MTKRPTVTNSGERRLGMDIHVESLDDALYEFTRDGFERAELAMMVLLVAERNTMLKFSLEAEGTKPVALAYWTNRSPFLKLATMSGALFLRDRRDIEEISRVSTVAFERDRFELGWFRIPSVEATRRVRFRIARTSTKDRVIVVCMARESQDVLPLGDSYDAFVKGLGRRTRRNIRHFRRHAAESAITFKCHDGFLPEEMYDEIFELGAKNGPKSFSPESVLAWRARLSKQTGQFYSIMSSGMGEMISLCRGFVWGKSAIIVYQLNSRDHYEISPSLLHRSFLIEHLIGEGVREIIFTDGCEGLLKDACVENHGSSALVILLSLLAVCKAILFVLPRISAWDRYLGKLLRSNIARSGE